MKKPQQDWTEYVKQTSQLMNLNLSAEYLSGVTDNFAAIADTASLVMEFQLPEDVEIAPIFEP